MTGEMSHEDLCQAIYQLAHLKGWRCARFRSVRVQRKDGSCYYATPVAEEGEGFPDKLLVRGKRIIAAEIKVKRDTLKPAQIEWLAALKACGCEIYCWREKDWTEGEIERILE